MTERHEGRQDPARPALSDGEIRSTLYFAVGVTSESGYKAYQLAVAGDNPRTAAIEPADRSGYTIGTIQVDLGQHYQPNVPNGENVPRDLVSGYQAWARVEQRDWVLTPQQEARTIEDLGRDGNAIRADGGRDLDATTRGRLDAFLASNEGIDWVHARDTAQVDRLMENVVAPLQRSDLYRNATQDDQVRLVTMVSKAYNQNEHLAAPMIRNLERGQYHSVADVDNAIGGLSSRHGDYFETGRDRALLGADVANTLRGMHPGNPLRDAWRDVSSNPLVNPTRLGQDAAHPNLPAEYATVRTLFLHYDRAVPFVHALDQGGTYQHTQNDREHPGRLKGPGLVASGNDFAVWDKNGKGHANLGGQWVDFDRRNLTRVDNRDGTFDLNLTENGRTRSLMHVDPNAPALRPARGNAEPNAPERTGAPAQPQGGQPPHAPAPAHGHGRRPDQALLDDRDHPRNGMYQQALAPIVARDAELRRSSDDSTTRVAAGMTAEARGRGLETIAFAQFSADGRRFYMVDTPDPSTPWARTAVGDIGQALQQSVADSTQRVAQIDQTQALAQQQTQTQQQSVQQSGPVIQGHRLA